MLFLPSWSLTLFLTKNRRSIHSVSDHTGALIWIFSWRTTVFAHANLTQSTNHTADICFGRIFDFRMWIWRFGLNRSRDRQENQLVTLARVKRAVSGGCKTYWMWLLNDASDYSPIGSRRPFGFLVLFSNGFVFKQSNKVSHNACMLSAYIVSEHIKVLF